MRLDVIVVGIYSNLLHKVPQVSTVSEAHKAANVIARVTLPSRKAFWLGTVFVFTLTIKVYFEYL